MGIGVFGLLLASVVLLQGVAQLEGEVLAKRPETPEEVQRRLLTGLLLLAAATGCGLVFQVAGVCADGLKRVSRSRLRWAVFQSMVFGGGACLFFCVLLFVGSYHARWQVDPAYYWLAGGAGVLALVLLGTAGLFYQPPAKEAVEPGGVSSQLPSDLRNDT